MSGTDPDADGDDTTTRILDPEQYTQHRRLEQIHDTRDVIPEARREAYKALRDKTGAGPSFRRSDQRRYVATAVLDYAIEVEPVAHRSDSDVLDKEIPDTSTTISDVLNTGGEIDGQYMSLDQSRWVRRQLDMFLADIGLGLDIDSTEDAEADYADLV
jgi:hypothetical protein